MARAFIDSGLEYWGHETLEEDPDPTSPSNETSVVQLVNFDGFYALFTGDAGPEALHEAADYAHQNGFLHPPNMFQIPHQGSRRNVTPSALNRWLGPMLPTEPETFRWAACSVGTNKNSHPRKKVTNALRRRGCKTALARANNIHFYGGVLRRDGYTPLEALPFFTNVTEDDDA